MNTDANDKLAIEELTVGILVGGQSRRMGASKALLCHPDGGTFVEYVIRVVRDVAKQIVLLGECEFLPNSSADIPILPDSHPGGGPLVGLQSLLRLAGNGWALLLSCDLPNLSGEVIASLARHASPDVSAFAFASFDNPTRLHACCALYHTRILPVVESAIRSENFRMQDLLSNIACKVLTPTREQADQLRNINTPQDYDELTSASHKATRAAQGN